ncbi:MAG: WhiB family transcriptional regulator, partial [Actinobacteria bacterium]|nr:WhiB family transcriptional regulator [Actinomycetota bacterium]
MCPICPVVAECLAHALDHRETRGAWGGMTPVERRRHRLAAGRRGCRCTPRNTPRWFR